MNDIDALDLIEFLLWGLVLPFGLLLSFLGNKEDFFELESGDISWDTTDILVGLIGILQTIFYYSGVLIALMGAVFWLQVFAHIVFWFFFSQGYLTILAIIVLGGLLAWLLGWLWSVFKK